MRAISVRRRSPADSFKPGDTLFIGEVVRGGHLLVEQAEVLDVAQRTAMPRPGDGQQRHPTHTEVAYRTVTGGRCSFVCHVTDLGRQRGWTDSSVKEFLEGGDIEAVTYEQTGTAVSVTVLVDDNDQARAEQQVRERLAGVQEIADVRTQAAYDRTAHHFTTAGEPLGTLPHWQTPSRSSDLTVPGVVPFHEAVLDVARHVAERDVRLRSGGGTRSPASGPRKPRKVLSDQEREEIVRLSGELTNAQIAVRFDVSVSTIYNVLRQAA